MACRDGVLRNVKKIFSLSIYVWEISHGRRWSNSSGILCIWVFSGNVLHTKVLERRAINASDIYRVLLVRVKKKEDFSSCRIDSSLFSKFRIHCSSRCRVDIKVPRDSIERSRRAQKESGLLRMKRTLRDAEGDDAGRSNCETGGPLQGLKLQGRSPDCLIHRVVAVLAHP